MRARWADEFGLAFVTAVAFATILAVVAGLTISASTSFTHDIYNGVIKRGQASEREQFRVARLTTVAVGAVPIVLGLLAQTQNVAFLVALAFAIAASANLPVILFTLFWKKFNATGAVWGLVGGILTCLALIAVSPNIMGIDPATKLTGRHPVQAAALFPLGESGHREYSGRLPLCGCRHADRGGTPQ